MRGVETNRKRHAQSVVSTPKLGFGVCTNLSGDRAIWRGYKEIKDAGGWASLVFSGSGVYRFCKYRIGFDEGLTQQLEHMRHGLEVAADTLHPGWRELLGVVGQESRLHYAGHPHEWVIFGDTPAAPLRSTYRHLQWDAGFQFVDECVIDQAVFRGCDPRRMPEIDPTICPTCQQQQSDDVRVNRCTCFPTLFGGLKIQPAVQIFNTGNAKNNGVLARLVRPSDPVPSAILLLFRCQISPFERDAAMAGLTKYALRNFHGGQR